jgi:hypothetical protein
LFVDEQLACSNLDGDWFEVAHDSSRGVPEKNHAGLVSVKRCRHSSSVIGQSDKDKLSAAAVAPLARQKAEIGGSGRTSPPCRSGKS